MGDTYAMEEAFDDYMLDRKMCRQAYRSQRQTLFWTVLAVTLLAIGVFFGQGSSRYMMYEEMMEEYYYLARLIAEKQSTP